MGARRSCGQLVIKAIRAWVNSLKVFSLLSAIVSSTSVREYGSVKESRNVVVLVDDGAD